MTLSISILFLGIIILLLSYVLKPVSSLRRKNNVFSAHFRRKKLVRIYSYLGLLVIVTAMYPMLKRNFELSELSLLFLVIALLAILSFVFFKYQVQYSLDRLTLWMSEIICPLKMKMGDSYRIKIRIRPVTVKLAGGHYRHFTRTIGLGDAAILVRKAFDEKPPQFSESELPDLLPLKIQVHAPGFDVEPKEIVMATQQDSLLEWNTVVMQPKTAGNHEINLAILSAEEKLGEANLLFSVKQFLLFGKFGLNDNQMRIMELLGLLFAITGGIIALLKAFGLI